jgi:hypothetical protein
MKPRSYINHKLVLGSIKNEKFLLAVEAVLMRVATNKAAGTIDKPNRNKWMK